MTGALARYRQLHVELLLSRLERGGALPMAEEATYAAELDRCWQQMTDDEQAEVEVELANPATPSAPATLDTIDLDVHRGDAVAPRKAA